MLLEDRPMSSGLASLHATGSWSWKTPLSIRVMIVGVPRGGAYTRAISLPQSPNSQTEVTMTVPTDVGGALREFLRNVGGDAQSSSKRSDIVDGSSSSSSSSVRSRMIPLRTASRCSQRVLRFRRRRSIRVPPSWP